MTDNIKIVREALGVYQAMDDGVIDFIMGFREGNRTDQSSPARKALTALENLIDREELIKDLEGMYLDQTLRTARTIELGVKRTEGYNAAIDEIITKLREETK